MSNQLTVNFSKEDVQLVNCVNQRVIVLKQLPGSSADVAWLVFEAFEKNTVSWNPEYSVYASRSDIEAGAVIDKQSETGLLPGGSQLNFKQGAFDFINKKGDPGTYNVNYIQAGLYDEQPITIGLAQPATVNGNISSDPKIISAGNVLFSDNIKMTPEEKITVFMQSQIQTGQVLSTITSQAITLEFSGSNNNQSITYQNGTFVKDS
ncbi:hypothetical protein [Chengkuizengella axinellae]|uniref:Uncharacterized protein n=1 Tax=Chengkuizengella axinellae TaxID=3064388 RepID=A0ABT9J644_9BACL|nr:hypothetical protein [Chengkuizengella sp. 2205SS18-9]MDP5277059.1 hypothetical protein [Chengkuizengella sp. 2205SS18-9]